MDNTNVGFWAPCGLKTKQGFKNKMIAHMVIIVLFFIQISVLFR